MARYFGRSVAALALPLQANVVSGSPPSVMHRVLPPWSTPMNQVAGLSCAFCTVGAARLKAVETMMVKPCSTYAWIEGSYSEASFGTVTGGSAAPIAFAPSFEPTKVNSLKFLSLTLPTSVTTPIFQGLGEGCPVQATKMRAPAISTASTVRMRMLSSSAAASCLTRDREGTASPLCALPDGCACASYRLRGVATRRPRRAGEVPGTSGSDGRWRWAGALPAPGLSRR